MVKVYILVSPIVTLINFVNCNGGEVQLVKLAVELTINGKK